MRWTLRDGLVELPDGILIIAKAEYLFDRGEVVGVDAADKP
jgi:hypothetical protein